MTEEEAEIQVRRVVAVHEHEGLTVSLETQEMCMEILRGNMTVDEAVKKVKARIAKEN